MAAVAGWVAHRVRILRPAKHRERKPRGGWRKRVEEQAACVWVSLSPGRRIRQQSLIFVASSDVLPSANPMRIKGKAALRTRVVQTGHLGLIGIVQVRKSSARADHVVQRELITQPKFPELLSRSAIGAITEKFGTLRSTGNNSHRKPDLAAD